MWLLAAVLDNAVLENSILFKIVDTETSEVPISALLRSAI